MKVTPRFGKTKRAFSHDTAFGSGTVPDTGISFFLAIGVIGNSLSAKIRFFGSLANVAIAY